MKGGCIYVVTGKPSGDFVFKKALKGSPDWQTVTIKPGDMLKKDSSDPLPSWETVTELNLTRPADPIIKIRGQRSPRIDSKKLIKNRK